MRDLSPQEAANPASAGGPLSAGPEHDGRSGTLLSLPGSAASTCVPLPACSPTEGPPVTPRRAQGRFYAAAYCGCRKAPALGSGRLILTQTIPRFPRLQERVLLDDLCRREELSASTEGLLGRSRVPEEERRGETAIVPQPAWHALSVLPLLDVRVVEAQSAEVCVERGDAVHARRAVPLLCAGSGECLIEPPGARSGIWPFGRFPNRSSCSVPRF